MRTREELFRLYYQFVREIQPSFAPIAVGLPVKSTFSELFRGIGSENPHYPCCSSFGNHGCALFAEKKHLMIDGFTK